jgi:hypothetical protein
MFSFYPLYKASHTRFKRPKMKKVWERSACKILVGKANEKLKVKAIMET